MRRRCLRLIVCPRERVRQRRLAGIMMDSGLRSFDASLVVEGSLRHIQHVAFLVFYVLLRVE